MEYIVLKPNMVLPGKEHPVKASPEQVAGIGIDTFVQEFRNVDRAILDGEDDGFVKVHVKKDTDTIVGATIVARHAGDMISEITLAMTHGLGLKKIGSTIHPYPTQAEAIRKLGDQFSRTRLTPLCEAALQQMAGLDPLMVRRRKQRMRP